MANQETFEPSEFQKRVLSVPEDVNIALFGGKGGGKSVAIQLLILHHLQKYKSKAATLVVRKQLKSLHQFANDLERIFTYAYGREGFRYNGQTNQFTIKGAGGTVTLGHCESQSALIDLATGMSFSNLVVDEFGHAPSVELFEELQQVLRVPNIPLRAIVAGNPNGQNHSAIFSNWIQNRQPGQIYELDAQPWVTIHSTLKDNPHLPTKYRQRFESLKRRDLAKYQALTEGRWDLSTGDFFANLWDFNHHVIDHTDIPLECFDDLHFGADWGTSSPSYHGLLGKLRISIRIPNRDKVLPEGAWILLDEYASHQPDNLAKGDGSSAAEQSHPIRNVWKRNNLQGKPKGFIDAAASARSSGWNEPTIADNFRTAKILYKNASKGPRVPRLNHFRELLATDQFFVANRCKYFLQTVPQLPRSERNPEDTCPKSCDHALDGVLYGIVKTNKGGGVTQSSFLGRNNNQSPTIYTPGVIHV